MSFIRKYNLIKNRKDHTVVLVSSKINLFWKKGKCIQVTLIGLSKRAASALEYKMLGLSPPMWKQVLNLCSSKNFYNIVEIFLQLFYIISTSL